MINSPEISRLMCTLINRCLIYEDLVSVSTIPAGMERRRQVWVFRCLSVVLTTKHPIDNLKSSTELKNIVELIMWFLSEEEWKWNMKKLTNLSPSCSTRQFRNAVCPTRVVTFRATERSKYGCDEKFWFMLLLSRRLFVSKFLYAWYGSRMGWDGDKRLFHGIAWNKKKTDDNIMWAVHKSGSQLAQREFVFSGFFVEGVGGKCSACFDCFAKMIINWKIFSFIELPSHTCLRNSFFWLD